MTHRPIPAAEAIKIMRDALNHIALLGDADNTSVIALEATANIEKPSQNGLKPNDSDFLAEYLRLWEERENAPKNELASIQAWLMFLGEHDKETTLDVMRKRMYLLMNKSVEIYEKGESEEDLLGIYQNRSRDSFAAAPTPNEMP